MSNVMATTARNRYGHLIYVAGGLLLGFSIGVDVTRKFPREASWFGSPAFYISTRSGSCRCMAAKTAELANRNLFNWCQTPYWCQTLQ
jgi:hypothetical protein